MSCTAKAALSVVLFGLAVAAPASPADRFGLESQLSLKAMLMPPPPLDEKKLELDVDQAIAEIMARKRDEELIRELMRTPGRRPDLEHDVVQGIQGLNIDKALRRK